MSKYLNIPTGTPSPPTVEMANGTSPTIWEGGEVHESCSSFNASATEEISPNQHNQLLVAANPSPRTIKLSPPVTVPVEG
mmetsp:Transcript_29716/g.35047  ORF Transcript_29716/g.35047 Transcript_29716/m.35047 type:complete len:80 (+) Transcript_29716:963-1202(+)